MLRISVQWITFLSVAISVLVGFDSPTQGQGPDASSAERINRLQKGIESAKAEIASIQKQFKDPNSEYTKAEKSFRQMDDKINQLKKTEAEATTAGKPEEAQAAVEARTLLQPEWQKAKEQFELAIQSQKTSQEKLKVLEEQIQKDNLLLDQLLGKEPIKPGTPTTPGTPKVGTEPKPNETSTPKETTTKPPMTIPGVPGATLPSTPAPNAEEKKKEPETVSAEVLEAQKRITKEKEELERTKANLEVQQNRVEVLEQRLALEEKTLANEEQLVAQIQKEVDQLNLEFKTGNPIDPNRVQLPIRINDAERRLSTAKGRVKLISDRVRELRTDIELARLELQQLMKKVENQEKLLAEAEDELASLTNPFRPMNILRRVQAHAPNTLLIILALTIVYFVSRFASRHIVELVTRNGTRNSVLDRENRATTLVGVFRYAMNLLIFGGGTVMLLDEFGVPIVPLMGGAAMVGLAIAFGAQNMIRDYFTGFMILLEDQYGLNDVVRIGAIAGVVEKITLRMTVLRDLEGVVHFIPHSSITTVSNLTHTWSRAMIDVAIPHTEDVNEAIKILESLGKEMMMDPVYGLKILETPEMLGVDAINQSAVIVRFLLKTRPLQQWSVKREMLRRIKCRFMELGIEVPAARQTIRVEDSRSDSHAEISPYSLNRA